jgi:hypothetical protein
MQLLSCATRSGYAVTNTLSAISLLYERRRAHLDAQSSYWGKVKGIKLEALRRCCICYLYIIISSRLSHLLHTVDRLQEDATEACELVPKLSKRCDSIWFRDGLTDSAGKLADNNILTLLHTLPYTTAMANLGERQSRYCLTGRGGGGGVRPCDLFGEIRATGSVAIVYRASFLVDLAVLDM